MIPTPDDERAARVRCYDALTACATAIATLILLVAPVIEAQILTEAARAAKERRP